MRSLVTWGVSSAVSLLCLLLISHPAWAQIQFDDKVIAADGAANEQFGYSVSVSGNVAFVGVPFDDDRGTDTGSVYIYEQADGNWSQVGKLSAADGAASDYFGWSVAVDGDFAFVGSRLDDDRGSNSGSAYVFERIDGIWRQVAKLTPTDGGNNDQFGYSVSVSGTTAVVGAYQDSNGNVSNTGSAYVFERVNGTWTQQAKLLASDAQASDGFGISVSISDDVIIAGASNDDDNGSNSGSAYVFERSGGWAQVAKITPDDGAASDAFGISVAVDGDTAVVGAHTHDGGGISNSGSAYVFERVNGTWGFSSKLTAEGDAASSALFGFGVDVVDDVLIVGSYNDVEGNVRGGASYLFERSGQNWQRVSKIIAGDRAASDQFGFSVALDGGFALMGAPADDTPRGSNAGSAYFFRLGEDDVPWARGQALTTDEEQPLSIVLSGEGEGGVTFAIDQAPNNGELSGFNAQNGAVIYTPEDDFYGVDTFTFQAIADGRTSAPSTIAILVLPGENLLQFDGQVFAADGSANEQFGYSVSVSGSVAFVGAPFDDDRGADTGSVYIYEQADGNWSQVGKLSAADGAASDYFGWSVAVDGDFAFVGSRLDDDRGSNSGSAYVFERIDGIWRQVAKLTPTDGGNNDQFGYSVSVSGTTAVVGAYQDSNGNVSNTGSAYVFERVNGTWTQQAKLLASDAQASDGFGISVSISDDVIIAGASNDDDNGSNSGSAYVFEFDEDDGWQEVNKLVAPYGFNSDAFGISVSVDGNIAVVGSHTDDSVVPGDNNVLSNAGSAYVFERINNDWKQVARLTAEDDALSSALFGFDVDVSGNVLVVGAYNDVEGNIRGGSTYVFEQFAQGWRRTSKVVANNRAASDQFGFSVALDGGFALMGAPADDTARGSNAGSAYFFRLGEQESLWARGQHLVIERETSVNITLGGLGDQDLVFELVDGPAHGVLAGFDPQTGAVTYSPSNGFFGVDQFSFRVSGDGRTSEPSRIFITVRPDARTEQFDGQVFAADGSANEQFGYSVSVSGNVAFVGVPFDDDRGTDTGSVYIYEQADGNWSQVGKLSAADGAASDYFGWSVAVDGDFAFVGSRLDDDRGSNSGSAYVFERIDGIWRQVAKLTPTDGGNNDQFGYSVSVSGTTAVVGAYQDSNGNVSNTGSAYVFERANGTWTQQAKLLASDAQASDGFGISVSISDDVIIAGASNDDDNGSNSGSAYVFEFDGNNWQEVNKLVAPYGFNSDAFGISVSVDGNIAVVGSHTDDSVVPGDNNVLSNAGSAYVFERINNDWKQVARLTAEDDALSSALFGFDVDVSGNVLVVGAYNDVEGNIRGGSTYVFEQFAQGWRRTSKVVANNRAASDQFGFSVALDGGFALMGAPADDTPRGSNAGSAYFFRLGEDDVPWARGQALTTDEEQPLNIVLSAEGEAPLTFAIAQAPANGELSGFNAQTGEVTYTPDDGFYGIDTFTFRASGDGRTSVPSTIAIMVVPQESWAQFEDKVFAADGSANEQFGYSVSVSGNVAIVGVPFDDVRTTDTGSAYIYEKSNGSWALVDKLSAADGAASDYFGWSVAVDGNFAFVGSRLDDDRGSNSGSVYIFERVNGTWTQQTKLTPTDGGNNDQFGYSVSVSGTTAVVGAYQDSNGNVSNSGSAYVFERANGTWTQQAKLLASDAQASDGFGISVSISDDVIIAGASSDDDKGSSSGSAYVFEFDGNGWQEVNKLVAPYGFTSDQFGISVSVDGNIAVVGSHTDDSVVPGDNNVLSNAGSAYVFERINNDWKQVARLTAEDDALSSALFGFDVDVSGNVLVVGAYNDVEGNIRGGSAYFFERFNQGWRRTSKVIANDRAASDQFGFSVALDGRDGIIGAPADDTPRGSNAGSVYFFDVENRSGLFANPLAVTTPEETPVGIALTGQGAQNLTFELLSQPSNGVLSGFNAQTGAVTYTPAAGFDGADAFSFRVVANGEQSAPATVSITVTPVNDAPTANAQAVSTNEEVAVNITLTGNDPDGDDLTFAIVGQPSNGTLSGFNAQTGAVTYTPAANFSGQDTFTFRVSDGEFNSAPATVTVTVNEVNDAPTANAQSVSTNEDTAVNITLTGNDLDGDDLTFTVLQQPPNGTLSNFNAQAGTVTYTPNSNFSGNDSFTFRVSDGQANSDAATVSITVNEVNDAPVANAQSVSTNEDTAVNITLTGNDPDGDNITFALVDQPDNGTLSNFNAQTGAVIYTPADGFSGLDSFTFRVSDGQLNSTTASVTITVNDVNDAPTANDQSVSTNEDVAVVITLTGADVDGDELTFAVLQQPANGALSDFDAQAGTVTYTPADGFNGNDSFTFRVSDGEFDSAPATVSITVNAVNDAPTANDQTVSTNEETAVNITLTGNDPDGDDLTFAVLQQPANGTLSNFDAQAGTVTYAPADGFSGNDSFTFRVSDGALTSEAATVSITVNNVNDAPTANDQSVSTNEETAVNITLTGNDPDGDDLAFAVLQQPANGVLSNFDEDAGTVTYTPNDGFNGNDSFTFRVSDGEFSSAFATVNILVNNVNDAPTANDQSVTTNENTAVVITLTGNDPDGDDLTFAVLQQPANGLLSDFDADAGTVTYTPADGFSGLDSFTFRVSDGQASSEPAVVSLTVNDVNDAPVANDQSVTTEEDTAITITLTGNDPDGDDLVFAVLQQPANGTLSNFDAVTGAVVYTPAENFSGQDSFTFRVSDGQASSGPATVTINVEEGNDPPTVEFDIDGEDVEVNEGESVTLEVTVTDDENAQVSIDWDLDGDGQFDDALGPSAVFRGDDGPQTVRVSVRASDGEQTTVASLTVRVLNVAPEVTIEGPTEGEIGQELNFVAVAVDPAGDGDLLAYSWSFGDNGPNAFGPNSRRTFTEAGTYTVSVVVDDGEGGRTTESIEVEITAPLPEVFDTTIPLEGDEGEDLAFSAAATGVEPLTYRWDFGDGTEEAEGQAVTHAFGDNGTYIVTLTITDALDRSVTFDESVTILNVAPSVTLLESILPPQEGEAFGFNATAIDPAGDNDTLTYRWDFGDGSEDQEGVDLTNVEHTYADSGVFELMLIVSDEDGGTTIVTRTINVGGQAPNITSLGGDATGVEASPVSFEAEAADPGNDALTYRWDFGDGSPVQEGVDLTEVEHAYGDNGSYTVTLTVSDEDGSATATRDVLIINAPPTVEIEGPTEGNEGQELLWVALGEDPAGENDPLSYRWNFSDGATAEGRTARHTFANDGTYTVTVTALDDDGGAAAAVITVVIGNGAPVIGRVSAPSVGFEGQRLGLSAEVDDAVVDLLTWTWDFGDGTILEGADLGEVEHVWANNGDFTVTLTVTDDGDLEDSITFDVTILNLPPRIVSQPSRLLPDDLAYRYTIDVEEPGDDELFFELQQNPEGMTVTDEGEIVWDVALSQLDEGPFEVLVEVCDEDGACDSQRWRIDNNFRDEDGDDVPDLCEEEFGFEDGDLDNDQDGISNRDECLDGTDPNVSNGPNAPTRNLPEDDSRVEDRTPELSAFGCVDPDGDNVFYTFEAYADAALDQLLVRSPLVPEADNVTVWEVPFSLPEDATIFWRVRCSDRTANSPWSDTGSFVIDSFNAAPPTPELVSPMGSVDTLTPELVVDPVEDPDGDAVVYLFEVYADAELTDLVTGGESETTAFVVDVELSEDTPYWWTAAARDARGEQSAYADAWRFEVNTENGLPTAPVIVAPEEGQIFIDRTSVVLRWLQAEDPEGDALTYDMQLATDADFNEVIDDRAGMPAGEQQAMDVDLEELALGQTYHARVRANDPFGAGPFATVSFELRSSNRAPEAPVLISPIDDERVQVGDVDFVFDAAVDPDEDVLSYVLRVFPDATVGEDPVVVTEPVELGQGEQTITVSLDIDPGNYTWDLTATDPEGEEVTAGPASFVLVKTTNEPPTAPVAIAPIEGVVLTEAGFDLEVENATDPEGQALRYTFEIYSDQMLTDRVAIFEDVAEGDSGQTTAAVDALEDGTWFWVAFATDVEGAVGPSSAVAEFVLDTDGIDDDMDPNDNVDPDVNGNVSGGGCDCAVPGQSGPRAPTWPLIALALAALVIVRRKR